MPIESGRDLPIENISGKISNSSELPQANQMMRVKTDTTIRSQPDNNSYASKELIVGDQIYFQNILNNDPTWFYVTTIDKKIEGWCFSNHLEKC